MSVLGRMTIGNALGFFLLGTGMIFVPLHAPEIFISDDFSKLSRSTLWLNFMGWVNGTLGGFYLVKNAVVPQIIRILEWRPVSPKELLNGQLLRPAMKIYTEVESRESLGEEQVA